jgi:hypothetical protein
VIIAPEMLAFYGSLSFIALISSQDLDLRVHYSNVCWSFSLQEVSLSNFYEIV